ncbi:hypothetical protein SASPL_142793 [Salvia splendens]|uniref:AP2/ERF domain-containing protein n=1 Tax=Salvia splendens TaxID=180675 RepID=A0A8X8WKE1_SALSN|nr:hypothetical protein SASPL_142793 [Salvia splendens]
MKLSCDRKGSRGKKLIGAHKRTSGRYSTEIWDPHQKRRIWLGTFTSAEEASLVYLAAKRQIQEQSRPTDETINCISSEKTPDESGGAAVREDVSGDKDMPEWKIGFLCGVEIVDRNGFLVGEFSKVDDLSISTAADGVVLAD